MKDASKQRSSLFPPPVGWLPILVALAVVTVASVAAFVPQYGNRQIVGTSSSSNGTTDTGGGTDAGATPAPGSGQGHAVTSGGAAVAQQSQHAGSGPGGAGSSGDCAHGRNAGATDTGVTGSEIKIASTVVTTGIGSGFLGEAVQGMRAAINKVNQAGGICGRHVSLSTVNDGWEGPAGATAISNYINSGNVFALVGEPDSEGLQAATIAGTIDRASIPVVGTDGMLRSQYNDPWIWPVAASTVTNMHVVAQYAKQHGAHKVAIVYDNVYKFGQEGAGAFKAEVQRLAGSTLGMGSTCEQGFCGIDPGSSDYSTEVTSFNKFCTSSSSTGKCDIVVMLLEPQPMTKWMQNEQNCSCSWYGTLMGGEPLFDDNLANTCAQDCAGMVVWTGYKPDIQPFDSEPAVYTYAQSLKATCPSCDPHNEFTEGAYLGTQLFIAACQKVGASLTRAALQKTLNTETFDLGLSQPLHYGSALPHLANIQMAAFSDNATGSFNGWGYMRTGFISDPAPGQDLR
jgi:ABC-type branched-subunit amino acid transport system substrate-binding protein